MDAHVDSQHSRTGWQDAWRWARNQQRRSNTPVLSAGGDDSRTVRFQRHENYAVLSAELLIDEAWFQKATLKIEYWPDALRMPQLLMQTGRGGVNYRVEGRD